jgi:hypothetical protein
MKGAAAVLQLGSYLILLDDVEDDRRPSFL